MDAEEIADFLEEKGLGGKEEMEAVLEAEMVGRSVTDTVVQLSAKHTQIMKVQKPLPLLQLHFAACLRVPRPCASVSHPAG